MDDFALLDDKTGWKRVVALVKTRPPGWLARYANNLDDSNIFRPALSLDEQREIRIQNSGWRNTIVKVSRSREPRPPLVTQMKSWDHECNVNHPLQCMECWKVVSHGREIRCKSCPNIVHGTCIDSKTFSELSSRLKPAQKIVVCNSEKANVRNQKRIDDIRRTLGSRSGVRENFNSRPSTTGSINTSACSIKEVIVEDDLSSCCQIEWSCPFCVNELRFYNEYNEALYRKRFKQRIILLCCVRLQSYTRMLPARLRYLKFLKGIVEIQQIFRIKMYSKQHEYLKSHERYPFRIRLHNVYVLVRETAYDENSAHPPLPLLKSPYIIGDITSIGYEKVFEFGKKLSEAVIADQSDMPLFQLLSQGHIESPAYAKSVKNMQIIPKGALFISVSAHEMSSDDLVTEIEGELKLYHKPIQLCRIDLPLKPTSSKPKKLKQPLLSKLGFGSIAPDVLDYLGKHYKLMTYATPKPYMLIPYSRANVEIKMTLAEVIDWPKAYVVGQSAHNVKYCITHKRTTAFTQSLLPCSILDIPVPEEGSKLNLLSKPVYQSYGSITNHFAQPTRNSITHCDMSSLASHSKKEKTEEIEGGLVTWTILTMGYSDVNEAGFLMVLNQESVSSTKKKNWCVLIDRSLLVYSIIRDQIKLKYTLDIKSSYVNLLPDDVIRVKANTDTLYFKSIEPHEHDKWFRKLYSQSMSQAIQPHHLYVKRKMHIKSSTANIGSLSLAAPSTDPLPPHQLEALTGGNLVSTPSAVLRQQRMQNIIIQQLTPTNLQHHLMHLHARSNKGVTRTSMEEVEFMKFDIDRVVEEQRLESLRASAGDIGNHWQRQIDYDDGDIHEEIKAFQLAHKPKSPKALLRQMTMRGGTAGVAAGGGLAGGLKRKDSAAREESTTTAAVMQRRITSASATITKHDMIRQHRHTENLVNAFANTVLFLKNCD